MVLDYTVSEFVAAVICELGGRVEGVKKLMKLVFLAQYDLPLRRWWDRWGLRALRRQATKYTYLGRPLARAEFFIWSFGPMSGEVYDALDSPQFEVDKLTAPFTIVYKGDPPELPRPVARRVKEIVKEYGRYRGWELESRVLQLLGLDVPGKKEEYMGVLVDWYLREVEGLLLKERDLREET